MTEFAPVPDFARGPEIPESGYLVTELGGGAYGVTSGLDNTMFLVTKKGVVVVDAPLDLGEKLLVGIEEVTPKPITHLIYSHAHADHIGSAHFLARDGLKIVSHELTAQFIKEAKDDRRPLPNETFKGKKSELNVDGERIILEYTGDWHQAGNLFIHLPEQKILTAIDSFTVKNAPFFRLLFSAHVPAYFDAMDQMLDYDFETVVSGHMSLFGTPEDVQTNREYIRDLRAAAAEALRTVDLGEAAAGVPDDNRQARLKVWMDAVVARATELMPASWDKRLGGHDIFLADNLNAVAWSVFID
ncbi:MBL fold metallo-hydrolase [Nonomuraea sp. NEAU-A123]|uniref:MBL fold metallo-hydrolase n=1 Tax=Nonomuraea sp. NEAU-A123 TaxID=2839649 RepID=UPI001BE410ED|nr:MBL fold metallo-hydrolase [Nonomuraea sp. NEAU-A123]MBT2227942.1 MBL fold metallo-hydrolase [Nonomuraea sp. NEAU-A123]